MCQSKGSGEITHYKIICYWPHLFGFVCIFYQPHLHLGPEKCNVEELGQ